MKKILSIFLALAMTASALNVGYADEAAPVDDGAEDIVVSEAAVETDQNISLYSHSSTDTAYTVGSGTFYFDETTGTITDFVPDSSVIFDGIDYLYVPTAINDVDVKRIGKGAFWDACNKYDCHIGGLYINLGNVVQVDSNAFSDCSFDRMIIHAGDIGTDAFKNFDGYLAAYVQGNIGAGAFEGCKNLDITFTNISTQTIGSGAFRNCANMTKITLPSGLTTIGDNAFYGPYCQLF